MDPETLAKRTEAKEELQDLNQQHLPGKVKSQYALKYKLTTDINIEKALEHKERIFEKAKTKGRF